MNIWDKIDKSIKEQDKRKVKLSYTVTRDKELSDLGYTFLGALSDINGIEVHIFMKYKEVLR